MRVRGPHQSWLGTDTHTGVVWHTLTHTHQSWLGTLDSWHTGCRSGYSLGVCCPRGGEGYMLRLRLSLSLPPPSLSLFLPPLSLLVSLSSLSFLCFLSPSPPPIISDARFVFLFCFFTK